MRAMKWITMVGLLAGAPATAFAHGWRDPRPAPEPAAAVYVTPRVEVVRERPHHHWGWRHHAAWVPGRWIWVGHHRVWRRGYWTRAW
jgi:hypothetical protein